MEKEEQADSYFPGGEVVVCGKQSPSEAGAMPAPLGEELGAVPRQGGTLILRWEKQMGKSRTLEGPVTLGGATCHSHWEPLLPTCIVSLGESKTLEEKEGMEWEMVSGVSGRLEPAGMNSMFLVSLGVSYLTPDGSIGGGAERNRMAGKNLGGAG